MKKLVVYFSVEYMETKKYAEALSKELSSDIVEIVPMVPYTKADINWRNPLSRCNKEFFGKKEVPAKTTIENVSEYDEIYVGFPIWYGCAPLVVNAFLSKLDLNGKKIYVFATSGGSGIGKTAQKLEPFTHGAEIVDAKVFRNIDELISWAKK